MKSALKTARSKKASNGAHNQELRIAKDAYRKKLLSSTSRTIWYTMLAMAVIYFSFALSILRVLPTLNMAPVPVKNLTYSGGIVPKGKVVVVNVASEQGSNIADRFRQSFVPTDTAAVVRAKAGPYGKITWAPSGLMTVDGKPVGVAVKQKPNGEVLNGEYVVECVKGACTPGTGFVVSAKNIYGQPIIQKS